MSPMRQAPAGLSAGDVERRARYVDEVLDVLYPPAPAGPGVYAQFVVVPNARRPRLLVPVGSRQVAAAAVRRYAQPADRTARFKRDLAVLALRTGADRALLRDRITVSRSAGADTFDSYLRRALDWDVSVSVHIGPARANRKPVVQLIAADGETVGFAKLGTGSRSAASRGAAIAGAKVWAGTWSSSTATATAGSISWRNIRGGGRAIRCHRRA